jgi:uncharacterized protein (TIGR00251 family)
MTINNVARAVQHQDNGTLLHLIVKPGCDSAHFPANYNPWRQAIEIKVRSLPQKGQANKEIINMIQDFFKLGSNNIRLAYGATSTTKGVWIEQQPKKIIARLNNELKRNEARDGTSHRPSKRIK